MKKAIHLLLWAFICLITTNLNAQSIDSTCYITLRKGEVIYADSLRLIEPPIKRPYLLLDGEKKYGLHELKDYSNSEGYFRKFIDSIVSYPIWYKREAKGKINIYSRFMRDYSDANASFSSRMEPIYSNTKVFYTQIGDESPQKMTYACVKKLVKSNHKSLVLAKQGHQLAKAKVAIIASGVAMLIVGGALTLKTAVAGDLDKDPIKVSPLVFVGGIAVFVPFIFESDDSKYRKAVKVFNGN